MGCLKKLCGFIVFISIIYVFFAFGGFSFVKNKYTEYTSPTREVIVEEEKDFGNLENISDNYILSRSLNFFGYRKLNAYYFPKKQRITILDLNESNILTNQDFENGNLEKKLEEFSSKWTTSPIFPVNNIKITHRGKIKAGDKKISYAEFEANVKMIPFFKAKGTVAIYETQNKENFIQKIKKNSTTTPKLVISAKFPTGYDYSVTKNFISELRFN